MNSLRPLGDPIAVTPHQLVKWWSTSVPLKHAIRAGQSKATDAGPSLSHLVLGGSPTGDHLTGLREVQRSLHGKGVNMAPLGEIEIDGNFIAVSDMVNNLKYIVKGPRGVRERPLGVKELAQLIQGKVSSSSFPSVM